MTIPLESNLSAQAVSVIYSGAIADAPDATTIVGKLARFTDVGRDGGILVEATSGGYRILGRSNILPADEVGHITFGGTSATYSQSGTTVTVTQTAHGIPTWMDGSTIHLTQNTGTFITEHCTNLVVTGNDTFTCTSATSRTTSGNLGTNINETFLPFSYVIPSEFVFEIGDTIAPQFIEVSKNSAGTKTKRTYSNGVAQAAITATTGGLVTSPGAGTLIIMSPTTWANASLTDTGPRTMGNKTFTFSTQLASATDWAYRKFFAVTFTTR
jgi:hypothetical protein